MTASETGSVDLDELVSSVAAVALGSPPILAVASATPLPSSPSPPRTTFSQSDTPSAGSDAVHALGPAFDDPATPKSSASADSFCSVLFDFDAEASFLGSPSLSRSYTQVIFSPQVAASELTTAEYVGPEAPGAAQYPAAPPRTPSPLSPMSAFTSTPELPAASTSDEHHSPATPDIEHEVHTADSELSPASSYSSSSTLAPSKGCIDHVMFPDVFEAIISHCSVPVLLALRCTSKPVSDIVEPWLYGHIEVYADSDGASLDVFCSGSDHRLPFDLYSLWRFSSTQAIDLHGPLPESVFAELARYLTNVQTVYLFPDENGHCVDRCPIPTSNLVVVGEPRMPRTDPGDETIVMETRLQRVIIQVDSLTDTNGLWYHQLLYPYGTEEVVLVMSGWTQPFTPYVAARGRSTQRRDSHLSNERFQQLCRTIAHFITKQAASCGYTRCVIVDLENIDPEWFGVPEFVPLERHLEQEVREALGHWRSDADADQAAQFLQFYTASQWQAALAREEAERAAA